MQNSNFVDSKFLIISFLAVLMLSSSSAFAACSYSGTGNWNITDTDDCTNTSETIILNGNLTVYGNLTLNKVELDINSSSDGGFRIQAFYNSTLVIENSSVIDRYSTSNYIFIIEDGTTFILNNSAVHNAGYADATLCREASGFETCGLYLKSQDAKIINSTLTGNYVGLTLGTGANNTEVRLNTIDSNSVHGLYIYGSSHGIFYNNTFNSNTGSGVWANAATNNTFRYNTVRYNLKTANLPPEPASSNADIYMISGASLVEENTVGGIVLSPSTDSVTLYKNIIYERIFLNSADNNNLTLNSFYTSSGYPLEMNSSTGNLIANSTFYTSSAPRYYLSSASTTNTIRDHTESVFTIGTGDSLSSAIVEFTDARFMNVRPYMQEFVSPTVSNATITGTAGTYTVTGKKSLRYTKTGSADPSNITFHLNGYGFILTGTGTMNLLDSTKYIYNISSLQRITGEERTINIPAAAGGIEVTTTNTSVSAPSEVNVTVLTFGESQDTILNFTAVAAGATDVLFTHCGLNASENYLITEDSAYASTETANSSGCITFQNSIWSSHNFSVEKDRTAPSVSLSLSQTNVPIGSTVHISCSASDNYAIGSSSIRMMLAGIIEIPVTCNTDYPVSDSGVHTVTYTVSDTSGNSASVSRSFSGYVSRSRSSPPPLLKTETEQPREGESEESRVKEDTVQEKEDTLQEDTEKSSNMESDAKKKIDEIKKILRPQNKLASEKLAEAERAYSAGDYTRAYSLALDAEELLESGQGNSSAANTILLLIILVIIGTAAYKYRDKLPLPDVRHK